MLSPDDKQAIDGLFGRIEDVSRQYPHRDEEAQALIAEHLSRSPAAPYYMAQTLVMQEQALAQAQSRIAELEQSLSERPQGGGILAGLFGGGQRQAPPPQRPAMGAQPHSGQGGGFLAGAAQTALGVTGGVLLGSAIAGMLSPDPAMAEEPAPADEEPAEDFGDFGGDDEFGF